MSIIDYINETRTELKHVSWPTQKQSIAFTATVIVISIITAYFLGLFDFIFTRVLEMIVI